jgi:hypothetical protein
MNMIPGVLVLMFLSMSAHAATLPGDGEDGKRLHDAHCAGCHDTAVYSRKDHKVRSLDGLKRQFESCSHMANKEFSEIEAQNIIKYLNDGFYRFK